MSIIAISLALVKSIDNILINLVITSLDNTLVTILYYELVKMGEAASPPTQYKEVHTMLPIRWEPHREFRHFNRLMDRVALRPYGPLRSWPSLWDGRIRPALDVYETAEELVVRRLSPESRPRMWKSP